VTSEMSLRGNYTLAGSDSGDAHQEDFPWFAMVVLVIALPLLCWLKKRTGQVTEAKACKSFIEHPPVLQVRNDRVELLDPSDAVQQATAHIVSSDDEASSVQRRGILDAALEVQKRDGGFSGAAMMHREVRADYWGITWESFEEFMEITRRTLAMGDLLNTGRVEYAVEKFESPDIGPNMYQVNDQVIKPTTKSDSVLPGTSWAFRGGGVGAKVTLFVTHAWQEGAFEFERQLKRGWPESANGTGEGAAYICFLSNPQHLDIGAMLERIETSPFSVALRSMPAPGLMVMCGTKNGAIHERAWCVFEAYMALEQEVPICVPGSGVDLAVNREAVTAEAMRLYAAQREAKTREGQTESDVGYLVANCLCIICNPAAIAYALWYCCRTVYTGCRGRSARAAVTSMAAEAGDGHLVDVRNAKCTSPADLANILEQITGREEHINRLVGECILKAAAWAHLQEEPLAVGDERCGGLGCRGVIIFFVCLLLVAPVAGASVMLLMSK